MTGGFRETRLKFEAAEQIRNGLGEAADYDDPTWPRYIRTTDIAGPRTLRDETFASLPPDVAELAPVLRNDILMSAAGTIGRTYLHGSDEAACYAGYLVRFRPGPRVEPRFISYWTETPLFLDQVNLGAVRSTIDNFSAGKYQNLRLSLPPIRKQRAIADYLDAETARIDAVSEQVRRLQDWLNARLRSLVQSDLLSSGWRNVPLRRTVARIKTGGTPPEADEGDLAWFTPASFLSRLRLGPPVRTIPGEWARDGTATFFRADSTLLVGIGATAGRIAHLEYDGSGNQQLTAVEPSPGLVPRFLSWQLWARADELRGLASVTTLPIISNELLRSFPIALPPEDAQQRLVGRWDRASSVEEATAAASDRLQGLLLERRQALITAAVTGQLEIPGVAA